MKSVEGNGVATPGRWRLHAVGASFIATATTVAVLAGGAASAAATPPALHWGEPQSLNAPSPPSTGASSVSCTAARLCAAVGTWGVYRELPYAASTNDPVAASSEWSSAAEYDTTEGRYPEGSGADASVSCTPTGTCVAVGGSSAFTSEPSAEGPRSWTGTKVAGASGLRSVSCPTNSLCVAIDAEGAAFVDAKPGSAEGGWRQSTVATAAELGRSEEGVGASLTAVSCTGSEACVAVASDGVAYSTSDPLAAAPEWHGSRIDGEAELRGVSCAGEAVCVAFDGAGVVLATEDALAASWSATPLGKPITAVSCAAADFCALADERGAVLISAAPSGVEPEWSETTIVTEAQLGGSSPSIHAISCPSSSLCVAVTAFSSIAGTTTTIAAPSASTGRAQALSETEESLSAAVTPNGDRVTSCVFEYGTTSGYGSSAPCTPEAGDGAAPVAVAATVSGLTPSAVYHYRIVAENSYGRIDGEDSTFTAGSFESQPSGGGSGGGGAGGGGGSGAGGGTGKGGAGSGPGGGAGGASSCAQKVTIAPGIVALGCFSQTGGSYVASGTIRVDGLELSAVAGGSVTLTPASATVSFTGRGAVHVGPIPLSIWSGSAQWSLARSQKLQLLPSAKGKVFGFPITASVAIEFGAEEDATLSTEVDVSALGEKIGGSVALHASNAAGLQLNDLVIEVAPAEAKVDPKYKPGEFCPKQTPEGFVCVESTSAKGNVTRHLRYAKSGGVALGGKIPVEELRLEYSRESNEWQGSAKLGLGGLFPGAKSSGGSFPTVALSAGVKASPLEFEFAKAEVSGLNVPIGPVLLHEVGVTIHLHPSLELEGSVDLGAGPPANPANLDQRAVGIEGKALLKLPSNGFVLRLSGSVSLLEKVQLANASLAYESIAGSTKASFAGHAGLSFGPVKGEVNVAGAVTSQHFEAAGSAALEAFGQHLKGRALVSDAGLGACASIDIKIAFANFEGEAGFKHFWSSGKTEFDGCDFSGLQTLGAVGKAASASAVGREASIVLPPRRSAEELVAVGRGAPPSVELVGPKGTRIRMPAEPNRLTFEGHALAIAVSEADRTYFVVEKPAAGRWRVLAEPGAQPPARILAAAPIGRLAVHARVTGRREHRALRWHLRREPGESVEFVEEGRALRRTLLSTTRPRGRRSFVPAAGVGGARRIVAIASFEGFPDAHRVVARFEVPSKQPPRALHASYLLRRRTLSVSWRSSSAGAVTVVAATLRGGATVTREVPAGASGVAFTLPGSGTVRSVVLRETSEGLPGPITRARRRRTRG
ncbi:MAG: hypothetical protein ACYCU0_10015 [Solirubrobacteraceae bacterium]